MCKNSEATWAEICPLIIRYHTRVMMIKRRGIPPPDRGPVLVIIAQRIKLSPDIIKKLGVAWKDHISHVNGKIRALFKCARAQFMSEPDTLQWRQSFERFLQAGQGLNPGGELPHIPEPYPPAIVVKERFLKPNRQMLHDLWSPILDVLPHGFMYDPKTPDFWIDQFERSTVVILQYVVTDHYKKITPGLDSTPRKELLPLGDVDGWLDATNGADVQWPQLNKVHLQKHRRKTAPQTGSLKQVGSKPTVTDIQDEIDDVFAEYPDINRLVMSQFLREAKFSLPGDTTLKAVDYVVDIIVADLKALDRRQEAINVQKKRLTAGLAKLTHLNNARWDRIMGATKEISIEDYQREVELWCDRITASIRAEDNALKFGQELPPDHTDSRTLTYGFGGLKTLILSNIAYAEEAEKAAEAARAVAAANEAAAEEVAKQREMCEQEKRARQEIDSHLSASKPLLNGNSKDNPAPGTPDSSQTVQAISQNTVSDVEQLEQPEIPVFTQPPRPDSPPSVPQGLWDLDTEEDPLADGGSVS